VSAIRYYLHMLGRSERGATAVEYGLICALIIVAMIGGLQALGGGSSGMWGRILSNVTAAM
jgi:pilus assembly protein Flp/PilA